MSEYLPCLQQNCQKPAKKRTKTAKKNANLSVLLMIIVFFPLIFLASAFYWSTSLVPVYRGIYSQPSSTRLDIQNRCYRMLRRKVRR